METMFEKPIQLEGTPFLVISKLGEGGGGIVYKAYHQNLNIYVVLKEIKGRVDRTEVEVLKRLYNEHLPRIYDFPQIDGKAYIVMDFIPGKSFKECLDQNERFTEADVLNWAKQICETLIYMHGQNPPIIHCDLKPANIMRLPDNSICLIDFNVSTGAEGHGVVTGYTPGYASPEQIWALNYNNKQKDRNLWMGVDERADIYSFGACLYHMLSGIKPVPDPYGTAQSIVDIQDEGLAPWISDKLATVIMKCLEPNLENRYQSAADLYKDLLEVNSKKHLYYLGITACVALLCFAAAFASYRFRGHLEDQYIETVSEQWDSIRQQDYDREDILFHKAVKLDPNGFDAYYQRAVSLNEQKRYDENISFIESTVLPIREFQEDERISEVYFLLGVSYENQESPQDAARAYEHCLEHGEDNPEAYRNYAICLAEAGELDAARKAMDSAKDNGVDSMSLHYVDGQILYRQKEYPQAKEIFKDCTKEGATDYIRMRAYLSLSNCVEAEGRELGVSYQEETSYLEEGRETLPLNYRIQIMQRLAECYVNQEKATGNEDYYHKAIEVYQEMEEESVASPRDIRNMTRLMVNVGDYQKAESELLALLERNGEDYVTYRELALTQGYYQDSLPAKKRNYETFCEYYELAEHLYGIEYQGDEPDPEMEILESKYDAVKD